MMFGKKLIKRYITIAVPIGLCLMMLSGCSGTKSSEMAACTSIPQSLLEPSRPPEFTVKTWGDYPDYVSKIHLVLQECNADKEAIRQLMHVHE